ncbi:MAG: hypothetical protein ACO3KY_04015 [Lysobacterales bacterium]|jgi:hypothetical protein
MNDIRDMLKQTILLATAIFLMTAPTPDAQDLSEMSGGFFVQDNEAPLVADER